mgnify:CR=1
KFSDEQKRAYFDAHDSETNQETPPVVKKNEKKKKGLSRFLKSKKEIDFQNFFFYF